MSNEELDRRAVSKRLGAATAAAAARAGVVAGEPTVDATVARGFRGGRDGRVGRVGRARAVGCRVGG